VLWLFCIQNLFLFLTFPVLLEFANIFEVQILRTQPCCIDPNQAQISDYHVGKSCAQRKIEYVKEVILRYSPGKALDLSIFCNRENYFQKAGHRMQQMQFPPRLFSVCDLSPFVNRSIHSGFSLYPQNHCRRATYLCESSLSVCV